MKTNLLLAALTAVTLAGAPVLATALAQEAPGPDEEGYVAPDSGGDSSSVGADREGENSESAAASEPSGGEGGGGGGDDSAE